MQSEARVSRIGSEVVVGTEKPHQDRRTDYIEFTVADVGRSKDFCGKAFGWAFTDYGPDFCEFSDGHMKGGFSAGGPVTQGGPLVVLYGADLTSVLGRIEGAGGRIVRPVFEFPGGSRYRQRLGSI